MKRTFSTLATGLRLFARVATRVAALPNDQHGSVTLLSGMMVFMVTVFGIIAFDTNMAIHHRIVAQNAVDSAADAAALWQARSCNILQQLNNLHYDVDEAAAIAEGTAALACVASAALLAAEAAADVFFGAGEATIRPIRMGVCLGCDALPFIDLGQQLFYKAIMPFEQVIVDVTPFLVFGYANANAFGSGADPLLESVNDFLASVGSALGSIIPGLGDVGSLLSGVSSTLGGALGSIPIYAAPLDPTSLELSVKRRDNDGSMPLKFPSWVGDAGEAAGDIGCSDAIPPFETAMNAAKGLSWDGDWGWDDQYFFGHPGFMTWIAGKKKQEELLNLGNLKWLNGSMVNPDYQQNADSVSPTMYTGPITVNDKLQIPGFVAIASSEVVGTTVIAHGDVNAQGKIIKVYLPGNSPTPGDRFFIYH